MDLLKSIFVLPTCFLLASCTSPIDTISGAIVKTNGAIDKINSALSTSTSQQNNEKIKQEISNRPHLRDTAINILANSNSSEWPRVALTIKNVPKWFYETTHIESTDCITIKVVIWKNRTDKNTLDNLQFCGDEILPNISYAGLQLWGPTTAIKENTGNRRTDGPIPPLRLWQSNPGTQDFFFKNGNYYVGGIMATLGYNWLDEGDKRFWIVSVPTEPEVVKQSN